MGRRRTIEPDHIIQATLFLLSTRGVEAVTIPAIAQQAGISEASIYKFFTSKEDLLRTCIAESVDPQDYWRAIIAEIDKRSVPYLLEEAALFTVRHQAQHLPVLLLRAMRPEPEPHYYCSGPSRTMELQVLYFQTETEQGRIRSGNPRLMATAFCGTLFFHVFAERAILHMTTPNERDTFARAWAQEFWLSIRPC